MRGLSNFSEILRPQNAFHLGRSYAGKEAILGASTAKMDATWVPEKKVVGLKVSEIKYFLSSHRFGDTKMPSIKLSAKSDRSLRYEPRCAASIPGENVVLRGSLKKSSGDQRCQK